MTMESPQTVGDLRRLGQHVAVAFRNSARARAAAEEFAKWQGEGSLSIGPMACEGNTERRIAAIRCLGEFRTSAAVPYLERSIRQGPSATDTRETKQELFDATLAALFRTESYAGHRIVRVVYLAERAKWAHEVPGVFAKAFQGAVASPSWVLWSWFGRSSARSVASSDDGVDAFNRQQYVTALMQFSNAMRFYPYYSGYWRQMGDTKVRLARDGSKAEYDRFRKWWKANEADDELKHRLLWGGINDLAVARALAPFLPDDLVDIGYGLAMAERLTEAKECYDQALTLYPGEATRAYIHFRRAEAKDGMGDAPGALSDYRESKRLHESALNRQMAGGWSYVGLPYSLGEMLSTIALRIETAERP